jgi:hypothetical protein
MLRETARARQHSDEKGKPVVKLRAEEKNSESTGIAVP